MCSAHHPVPEELCAWERGKMGSPISNGYCEPSRNVGALVWGTLESGLLRPMAVQPCWLVCDGAAPITVPQQQGLSRAI